ncbi:uncharacterized protein C6orf136 homolog [Mantella aurantiaca]
MALCVRRLRGAPGLGGRWVSGGAAGRLREGSRVHDAILFRELRPFPGISTPARRPEPPSAIVLSPRTRPVGIRQSSPPSEQDRALQQLKDIMTQNRLPPKPVSQFFHCAEPSHCYPLGRECAFLSTAHLDSFRILFEPGVCRTPYQALVFSTPAAQEGLLEFTLSAKTGGSQTPGSNQPSMEEHLEVMREKLKEELSSLLWRPVNMTLYRKDMEFISSLFHVHLRGLVKYQSFLTFIKMLLLCYYMNSRISVLKLTSHPETNSIHARWSFTGLPLHSLLFFKRDKNELYRTYDVFSTFHLAPDGLISLHKLERVMPSSPLPVTKKTVLAAVLLAMGQDRPALNLFCSPKLPNEL